MRTRLAWLLGSSLGAAGIAAGCGGFTGDDCEANASCIADDASIDVVVLDGGSDHFVPGADGSSEAGDDTSDDGSVDAQADGADTSHCDPEGDPKTQGCVVTDTNGVFVSPTGNDTSGDGSRAKPFATIGKGATAAKGGAKHVFVCAGAYTAAETIGVAGDGVKIYGGIDCATGKYTGAKTSVAPAAPAIALTVDSLVAGLLVEDIEFDGADAVTPGASSIAVFVKSSANVTFRRVMMHAGTGAAGAEGAAGNNYTVTDPDAPAIAGSDANGGVGGPVQSCTSICDDSDPGTGGAGGNGLNQPQAGTAGTPDLGANGGDDGAGGFGPCLTGGTGHNGANAPPAVGGGGAQTSGTAGDSGWKPSSATNGARGGRGQGGGGGSGILSSTKGGGAGGGCGGCGGGGGTAGGTGGSSFACLIASSAVKIDGSLLHAGSAGTGGHGGNGQPGEPGGHTGQSSAPGCAGGTGGTGGAGGGGGGGAGGISVSVGHTGSAPSVTNTTTEFAPTAANGGDPGTGGTPAATAGIKGVAQAVLNLQ